MLQGFLKTVKGIFDSKPPKIQIITESTDFSTITEIDQEIIFTVKISETFQDISFFIRDLNNNEKRLQLNDTQETYFPSIFFNGNEMIISHNENGENIVNEFLSNIFDKTKINITNTISFQNKQFTLSDEEVFALLINQFIKIIRNKFTIINANFEIPAGSYEQETLDKLYRTYMFLGFKIVSINGRIMDNLPVYLEFNEHPEMKENVNEIQKYYEQYLIDKKEFIQLQEKIQEVNDSEDQYVLNIDINKEYTPTLLKDIIRKMGFRGKRLYKLYSISSEQLNIVAKYFDTLEDFMNLEFVSKKCKGILDNFTFNPYEIPRDEMIYFPNIVNIHFYSIDEVKRFVKNPHIKTFTHWYEINFNNYEKVKNDSHIYKKIYYSEQDRDKDYTIAKHHFASSKQNKMKSFLKLNKIDKIQYLHHFHLNGIVNGIADNCFDCFINLKAIEIPTNVTSIGKCCFQNCTTLSEITIPSTIISLPERCFYGCASLSSIELHTSLSSIGKQCFAYCQKLTYLSLPSSLIDIHPTAFIDCSSLKSLKISTFFEFKYDRIFSKFRRRLISIKIPTSVKIINEKDIMFEQLQTFTIPTYVNEIGNYCFANSPFLIEINGHENLKHYGIQVFDNCPQLKELPTQYLHIEEERKKQKLLFEQREKDRLKRLKNYEIRKQEKKEFAMYQIDKSSLFENDGLQRKNDMTLISENLQRAQTTMDGIIQKQDGKDYFPGRYVIEKWCQMKVGKTLIDVNDKNEIFTKKQLFNERLYSKSNILISIETDDGFIIGAFINNVITTSNVWIENRYDNKGKIPPSFVYTLRRNQAIKYPVKSKDEKQVFLLNDKSDNIMFKVGPNDIIVSKFTNNCQVNTSIDTCFEYGKDLNNKPLLGRNKFALKNLRIVQMDIVEFNEEDINYENQIYEITSTNTNQKTISPTLNENTNKNTSVKPQEKNFKSELQRTCEEIKQTSFMKNICKQCNRDVRRVLYDSQYSDYVKNTQEFHEAIFDEPQLVYIITTKKNVTFGAFIDLPIQSITDEKQQLNVEKNYEISEHGRVLYMKSQSFLFTTYKNKFKIIPFNNRKSTCLFRLYKIDNNALFRIGQIDVAVHKRTRGQCLQKGISSFTYGKEEKVLIGEEAFDIKRLVVVQLGFTYTPPSMPSLLKSPKNENPYDLSSKYDFDIEKYMENIEDEEVIAKMKCLQYEEQIHIDRIAEQLENDDFLSDGLFTEEHQTSLKSWTKSKVVDVIYHHEGTFINNSEEIYNLIMNKSKLVFLFRRKENPQIVFGVYLFEKIDPMIVNENGNIVVNGKKSFVFTFKNGEPKQYLLKQTKTPSQILEIKFDKYLSLVFGNNDLVINDPYYLPSLCYQSENSLFDYKCRALALIGDGSFILNDFKIIQYK